PSGPPSRWRCARSNRGRTAGVAAANPARAVGYSSGQANSTGRDLVGRYRHPIRIFARVCGRPRKKVRGLGLPEISSPTITTNWSIHPGSAGTQLVKLPECRCLARDGWCSNAELEDTMSKTFAEGGQDIC